MKKVILWLSVIFALILSALAISNAREPNLSTRIIIYIDSPMLEKGGAVIVSGRPINDDKWQLLTGSKSDENDHEKEFHVRVSSPASMVEFVYPESGTYSFKIVPSLQNSTFNLLTKEILVGSAEIIDPETKQHIKWPSMSVIHIRGSTYDESWARILSSTFDLAFSVDKPHLIEVQRFAAGRVISLSETAIEQFVKDTK